MLLLIPLFLSPEQQGYWYLFGSISALAMFADLGFTGIIRQFSAHEYAFLRFTDIGLLDGELINLKKLGSFLRFSIKWIVSICTVAFPVIYVVGIVFFIRDDVFALYFLPWTIYAVGSLINFFNNAILSFIEGLDKIEAIQNIRFRVAILNTAILAIILILGGNIYALAFGMLISSSSIFISIFGKFRKLLGQLWEVSKGFSYHWRKEVLPFFIKFAFSVASGYFLFQLYTPLMHYFHGPVYSGKVGITIQLVMAIFNMSNIWLYTITPKINMLIAQKSWHELDALFRKRLLLSIGTYLFIIAGVFVFVALFGTFWIIPRIISRFLPFTALLTLLACYFIQLAVNAWALYLRGHKQEPYVIPSIAHAIWTAIGTYLAGKFLLPAWFFIGFASGYVWGTPICYFIYKKCKADWHGK
jgi:O-antigen/teichoic acid export membrane protein